MVCGSSPSMCMRQQVAPAEATSPAIPGSERNADTSFTIRAPAWRIASVPAGKAGPARAAVGAHLGRATRKPGPRQRPRSRAFGTALRGLRAWRRRLRDHGLVGSEDLLLGLAVEQLDELLALDGLPADKDLGGVVELVAVLPQDVAGGPVRLLHDAPDLAVDLAGDVVRVVRLGAELAAQERQAVVV